MRTLLSFIAIVTIAATSVSGEQEQDINKIEWWKKTNLYHIYVRSFKDSDGDGNGDLRGVIQKLDYLVDIGVETILMAPFYSSPMKDGGYDIDDYCEIYPMFGTMKDFEDLVQEVKKRNMKILVDFIPNHSSNKHKWFECSERALVEPERCGKYKDYYVWSNSTRFEGKYPNNWISVFGGIPGWTWSHVREEFYMHQFLPEQPDLNLNNPAVREEFKEIARFWLRKGVDGLRVDAVIHFIEDPEFRDEPKDPNWVEGMDPADKLLHIYTRSLHESAVVVRDWQEVAQEPEFKGDKIIITEAYAAMNVLMEYYGPDPQTPYANMPFNFLLIQLNENNMNPKSIEKLLMTWIKPTRELGWPDEHGAMSPWICWVMGNHDNKRIINRVGIHNAAAFRLIAYMAPGVPVNYYGDELGAQDIPFGIIPEKTIKEGESSRLVERAPIPWTSEEPSGGFSNSSNIWLPLEPDYREKNVQNLLSERRDNFLKMFVKLQEIRKDLINVFVFGDLVFFRNEPNEDTNVFAMARIHEKFGNLLLLVNLHKSEPARVNLKANKSILRNVMVEPPKRAEVLLKNPMPSPTCPENSSSRLTCPASSKIIEDSELNIEELILEPSQTLLMSY